MSRCSNRPCFLFSSWLHSFVLTSLIPETTNAKVANMGNSINKPANPPEDTNSGEKSSSNSRTHSSGRTGGTSSKLGSFSFETTIDFNYDRDEKYKKPSYICGPKGEKLFAIRYAKNDEQTRFFIEALVPWIDMKYLCNRDKGVKCKLDASVGEAKFHVGDFGLEIQGPGFSCTLDFDYNACKFEAGRTILSAKLVGAHAGVQCEAGVKWEVGVGIRCQLRWADGAGVIIPGGGMVIDKHSIEFCYGPFSFKLIYKRDDVGGGSISGGPSGGSSEELSGGSSEEPSGGSSEELSCGTSGGGPFSEPYVVISGGSCGGGPLSGGLSTGSSDPSFNPLSGGLPAVSSGGSYNPLSVAGSSAASSGGSFNALFVGSSVESSGGSSGTSFSGLGGFFDGTQTSGGSFNPLSGGLSSVDSSAVSSGGSYNPLSVAGSSAASSGGSFNALFAGSSVESSGGSSGTSFGGLGGFFDGTQTSGHGSFNPLSGGLSSVDSSGGSFVTSIGGYYGRPSGESFGSSFGGFGGSF